LNKTATAAAAQQPIRKQQRIGNFLHHWLRMQHQYQQQQQVQRAILQ
jgi:hypothetical protein